jgi:hypothetical protein
MVRRHMLLGHWCISLQESHLCMSCVVAGALDTDDCRCTSAHNGGAPRVGADDAVYSGQGRRWAAH